MSILTKTAATLREQASRLEQAATAAPRNAEDFLRGYGPQCFKYRREVDLRYLGRSDVDYMKHVIQNAGVELGVKIGENLQAEYKGAVLRDMRLFAGAMCSPDTAIYEAEVFVLSRAELKALVEKAIRAGRESA